MIDIRDYPEVVETLNAIISNGSAAEVKVEGKAGLVIVELARQVKIKSPVKG